MNTSNSTQVNHFLRQERIGRNWRQKDLAELLGTTTITVKRWERGYQRPSIYFQIKLCALFGKTAQELGLTEGNLSHAIEKDSAETEQTSDSPAEPAGLWTVPYLRNPYFTGRDDLLDQLTQHLSFEKQGDPTTRRVILAQPQAVKGLGGIGKTQVAVEYAYRAREQNRYTHTFWINAASQEAIIASFQALAALLPGFADKDEQDQRKLIAAILHWLEQCQEPWLLIFDNADDLSLVQQYLPQQGQGSILLTTRAHAVGWLANALDVEPMSLMNGTQFLLRRAQRLDASDEECNEASNVVIALDGFPLALDQAGAYIEETGCSFEDYLQLYQQHRSQLLARRGKQATNYPDSVATTWSLSFEKVEQVQPAAVELLHLCAYLSPDHIPEELLTEGAAHWPPLLQQAVTNSLHFNDLLEALLAFSLVKRLAQEHLLSLHRLVQAVQMDQMDFQEQHIWAERVVCAVNTLFPADPKDEVNSWPLCLRYLEQVQACDRLIQQYQTQSLEAAELLDRAGIYLREHASYNLAETLFLRSLAIAEQHGAEHLQVATVLNNLGMLYNDQGKYEQAEIYSRQALHIWTQVLGPEHIRVALPLNNLGLLYTQQGKYEQAEPMLLQALHVWEKALGPDDSQVAGALNNLGALYAQQGKYEQAERPLLRALYIREHVLGPHHPFLVNPLINLGALYYEQDKYEQAEPFWQQALLEGEKAMGPNHPRIATSLSNLGALYTQQGKYEQAEPLLQRALDIREQTLAPNHPHLAFPLHELANLYREQGKYKQAWSLYQRVLALRQEHLSPQHPDLAETWYDLAEFHRLQQQTTEALSLYQQALTIREQVFGPQHPKTEKTRNAINQLVQKKNQVQ